MCPRRTMGKETHKNDLLFRLAGLLGVGLIGVLVMGCGLALAFGSYQLSTILFFGVITMLVLIKLVFRRWE